MFRNSNKNLYIFQVSVYRVCRFVFINRLFITYTLAKRMLKSLERFAVILVMRNINSVWIRLTCILHNSEFNSTIRLKYLSVKVEEFCAKVNFCDNYEHYLRLSAETPDQILRYISRSLYNLQWVEVSFSACCYYFNLLQVKFILFLQNTLSTFHLKV